MPGNKVSSIWMFLLFCALPLLFTACGSESNNAPSSQTSLKQEVKTALPVANDVGITVLQPMNQSRSLFAAAKGKNGHIYVFGGSDGAPLTTGSILSSFESYDPITGVWSNLQAMPGPKAWEKAATAPDGTIYLFGGSTDSSPSTDVWAYNPVSKTWNTSLPKMPVAERDTVAVTGRNGIIYLFGGYSNYNVAQAFNPRTKTWQLKAPMPTGRWAAAGALGPDGKIYIVGGGAPGEPDYGVYNTLEVYDPVTDTWATKSSMPTARNYLAAAFGRDGKLYAIGGEVYGAGRTGIIYNVIEAYDPSTDTWENAGNLPQELSALSAVTDNQGNIHVLGGYNLYESFNTQYKLFTGAPAPFPVP